MSKIISLFFVSGVFVSLLLLPHPAAGVEGWPDHKTRVLPDSSFALVEFDEHGNKVRHFPYRDMNGHVDINQLIYCLGTFGNETWIRPENSKAALKHLEDHYRRFRAKLLQDDQTPPVNINEADLKDLVRLTNIGPVTAVRICEYRENHGRFMTTEEIKKVEGIGPATFAGIKHYIVVH